MKTFVHTSRYVELSPKFFMHKKIKITKLVMIMMMMMMIVIIEIK
jgi:hypothetical protein